MTFFSSSSDPLGFVSQMKRMLFLSSSFLKTREQNLSLPHFFPEQFFTNYSH